MARKVNGPLTQADYERINSSLQGLEGVHQEIQMALQAGLQCQPEDQLCQDLKRRFNQIKGVYFPEMP